MPFSKAWRSAMYPDYRDDGAYIDYKATKEILHRLKEDIVNPATPDELYDSLLSQKKRVYEWCTRKQQELLRVARALFNASESLNEEESVINDLMAASANEEKQKMKKKEKEEKEEKEWPQRRNEESVVQGDEHINENDNTIYSGGGGGASNISLSSNPLSSNRTKSLLPQEARLVADSIIHELLRFVECRNLNMDTLEHILQRMYRYAVLGPTGDRWKNVYTFYDFESISTDEIFYYLSTVYDRVLRTEEIISAKGKAHVPSGAVGTQVFDRKSVKYWVHMQDLPFVIARIIQHLPLSTFKDTFAQSKKLNKPFTLYSPVSSVYYDNNKFLFYHRRLERIENSTLIRMRWYSDTYTEDMNALSANDNVFMEIKVHHEAWSGERSNKRRFALKEKDVDKYIHADLSLLPALAKLQQKGASEQEQENFKLLATEILTKIHSYELKPALRTQCGRAAFQRGVDQTVRVSIDTNLHMSAEDFGLSHHWRYTGNDAHAIYFPYAIVEVKLQFAENEKMPPWIEELMACRYMESIPKFSKYAHGIATLYGHTPFISMVPYWMHQLEIDIRASTKPEESLWDPTVGLASGCVERFVDRMIFGISAAQTQKVGAAEAQFLTRTDYARTYHKALAGIVREEESKQKMILDNRNRDNSESTNTTRDSATQAEIANETNTLNNTAKKIVANGEVEEKEEEKKDNPLSYNNNNNNNNNDHDVSNTSQWQLLPSPLLPPVVQYSVDRRHAAYTTFHLYPYAENGVESICFSSSDKQSKNDAAEVFYGTIPWQTGKRIRVPQKYDPKTLLTSERYMAKWTQLAVQFGLLGIASIRFGNGLFLPQHLPRSFAPLWRSQFHIVLGLLMVFIALMTLLYAYCAFKARARRVYARRKIRYDDTLGPTMLTFCLILTLAILLATHIAHRYGPMLTGSDEL